MGRPKATLPLEGGDTFVTRIVRTFAAAGISDVIVVVGHDADAVIDAFAGTDLSRHVCREPRLRTGTALVAARRPARRRSAGRRGRARHAGRRAAHRRVDGARGRRSLPRHARAHRAAGARRRARPSGADRSVAVRRAAPCGSAGGREGRRASARVGAPETCRSTTPARLPTPIRRSSTSACDRLSNRVIARKTVPGRLTARAGTATIEMMSAGVPAVCARRVSATLVAATLSLMALMTAAAAAQPVETAEQSRAHADRTGADGARVQRRAGRRPARERQVSGVPQDAAALAAHRFRQGPQPTLGGRSQDRRHGLQRRPRRERPRRVSRLPGQPAHRAAQQAEPRQRRGGARDACAGAG